MTDLFDEKKFCYVPLESACSDKRPSKFYPSVYWSMKACGGKEDEVEEEGSGEGSEETEMKFDTIDTGVSYHMTWNFTSTDMECATYCSNSERCLHMYSQFDAANEMCHLSTRPFYVLKHVHYGQWIKK